MSAVAEPKRARAVMAGAPRRDPGPGRGGRVNKLPAWVPVAAVLLGTGWGANQFPPLLLVYRPALELGADTLTALFGVYAAGLIPSLLVAGPLSDARGRRCVVVPAAVLSLLASAVLVVGAQTLELLFLGRALAGVSSGVVFAAGTAWLREVSAGQGQTAAQRAAIAMTAGFALGPLVSGLLAEWAPAPRVVPYIPHIAVMVVVLILQRGAPETVTGPTRPARLAAPEVREPRFLRVVAPMAPWVFASPAIAFGLLPSVVGAAGATNRIALGAGVTALTAVAGVLVQPLARRLDAGGRIQPGTAGLIVAAGALVLAAATAEAGVIWMLVPCAILFGSAYGLCLVAGIAEVGRLAHPGGLAGLTAVYYAIAYVGFARSVSVRAGRRRGRLSDAVGDRRVVALATAAIIARPRPTGAPRIAPAPAG